jgi:hypothetical protein
MEPAPRREVLRKAAYAVGGLLAALLILRRDQQRRQHGLTRRSAREVVASALAQTHIHPLRWLAVFIIKHRLSTYGLGLLVVFLLVKYQQLLRRVAVSGRGGIHPRGSVTRGLEAHG